MDGVSGERLLDRVIGTERASKWRPDYRHAGSGHLD